MWNSAAHIRNSYDKTFSSFHSFSILFTCPGISFCTQFTLSYSAESLIIPGTYAWPNLWVSNSILQHWSSVLFWHFSLFTPSLFSSLVQWFPSLHNSHVVHLQFLIPMTLAIGSMYVSYLLSLPFQQSSFFLNLQLQYFSMLSTILDTPFWLNSLAWSLMISSLQILSIQSWKHSFMDNSSLHTCLMH